MTISTSTALHGDRRHLLRWLISSALLVCVAHPVTAHAEAGENGPTIVSISSDELPGGDAVAISGLEVGQRLTKALARQAIRALWDTGRVIDVRVLATPATDGVTVRLQLRLNQVVRGLEVEYPDGNGEPALSQQDVARAIGYYAGMDWQPEAQGRIAERLEATYARRGYPAAQVTVAVQASASDLESVSLRLTVREGAPRTLSEVSFTGDLGLPVAEVRTQLGLSRGDVYDQVAVDEGLDRLLQHYRSQGYLQARIDRSRVTAQMSAAGDSQAPARLVIPIEAGNHYDVDFVGNRWISDDDLREFLNIQEESSLSQSVLDALALRLTDHYRRLGFYHVRVEWRVFQERPGRRRLAFRIRAGPQVTVRRIVFEGNDHFTDRYLRRQVEAQLEESLGRRGLFQPVSDDVTSDLGIGGEEYEQWRERPRRHRTLQVDPTEVYVEEVYAAALSHIRDLYGSDGYLNTQIAEPELTFSDRGRQLVVTIAITEGPLTQVSSLTFAGNQAFTDEQVGEALGLSLGDPLDRYEVEQGRRRVIRAYQAEGYVFVSVTDEEYVSEDSLSADVRYDIDEGPQVRVGDIVVRGNEQTRTELILDRIALRPGQVYTPTAADRSERALVDLGIFTTASVGLADPDTPGAVKDVSVEVVERPPQLLELRGGFSTADGPRLSIHYGYRNLFGSALGFDLRLQGSFQVFFFGQQAFENYVTNLPWSDRLERLVVASFNMPHLPRIGRVVSMRLDATHERNNDPAYAVTRNGVNLSLSSGYRPYLAAQLQTGFTYSDVAQVQDLPSCHDLPSDKVPNPPVNCLWPNPNNTQLSRAPQGASWFWVTRALLSLDLRDNPFNPTRGFYGSVSAEHVVSLVPAIQEVPDLRHPGETLDIPRSSNLIKFSTTLNGYIPLGWRDLVLALSARFGWIFELTRDSYTFPDRFFYLGGFDSMRGFYEESMQAQDVGEPGGNAMLNLRAELRVPLVSSFALGIFIDTGNIWRQQVNFWRDFGMRICLGAGLRVNTPVGPLALDGGFVVDRRSGEPIGAIHFAIGLF